jgi:CHAT domain-containing protein
MRDSTLRQLIGEAFVYMDQGSRHPALDELGAIARGELTGSSSEEVERHVAECDWCERQLEELSQFFADCARATDHPAEDLGVESLALLRRIRGHRYLTAAYRWGGIAAAVVLTSGLIWTAIRISTPSSAELLAQAYHKQRTFDLRMAGAKYSEVRRERGADSVFSFPEPLLKAQAQLAREIKERPEDVDILRLKGQAEMMVGQAGAAVQTLEKARGLQPENPGVLAGLGAAYALRGDLEKQPGDYLKALDFLGHSLRLEPNTPETVFNLALVLERALLKDQAAEKWDEYLRLDDSSGWSQEARKRLAGLRAQLQSREDALRSVSEEPGLFLARAEEGGTFDAETYLRQVAVTKWLARAPSEPRSRRALILLSQSLQKHHGDNWLADAIEFANGPDAQRALISLSAARAQNQKGDETASVTSAREAQRFFQRAGNRAGYLWARFEEVVGLRNLLRTNESLTLADELIRAFRQDQYPWLGAQTRIEYAISAMRTGRLGDARSTLQVAIESSRAAGLGETALRAGIMHLDCLRHTGLPSEILVGAHESLRTFWDGAYPTSRFQQIVDRLRGVATRSDYKDAALILARSGVWAASATLDARIEAPARAHLAIAAQAVGDEAEARAQLVSSDALFEKIPAGYRLEPEISLSNIELQRGEIDRALHRLLMLRDEMSHSPSVLVETRYHSALGEAYRRKGLLDAAAAEFRGSIERGRVRIESLSSATERTGVLGTIDQSSRGLVACTLAASSNPSESLREWLSFRSLDGERGPLNRGPDAMVITFAELPDAVVSWISRGDNVELHVVNAEKERLATMVARFRALCSDPASDVRQLNQLAARLCKLLIEPADRELAEKLDLVFLLDGLLSGLPIQALRTRHGYVAERFPILISSGDGEPWTGRLQLREAKALVIANPFIRGRSAGSFPPLPESEKEAAIVRDTFPNATVLAGRAATVDALKASLPTADIVHFAGHGYAMKDNAGLLFAAGETDRSDYGLLQSTELRRQDWSRCRLAVLSACATAGHITPARNPESLVRALTKAGVSYVVASLWSVDSAATAELMTAFYMALGAGYAPAHALHAAQSHVRQQPGWKHPYYWAAFQLYGTA